MDTRHIWAQWRGPRFQGHLGRRSLEYSTSWIVRPLVSSSRNTRTENRSSPGEENSTLRAGLFDRSRLTIGAGDIFQRRFFLRQNAACSPIYWRVHWKTIGRRPERTMSPAVQKAGTSGKVERPFASLQFEPAQVMPDHVRHGHSDRRGVILFGCTALLFGGFQQCDQPVSEICGVACPVETDCHVFVRGHIAKIT